MESGWEFQFQERMKSGGELSKLTNSLKIWGSFQREYSAPVCKYNSDQPKLAIVGWTFLGKSIHWQYL
jgi:hypothetical protein